MTNINRPDPATPDPYAAPPPLMADNFVDQRSRQSSPQPRAKRSRKQGGCLPWVIVIVVMLTAYAVWKFPSFKAEAELGASYAARIGCSCRYVQGRDINSCEDDFEPGMELISLTDDPDTKSVTGTAPLLATRTARFTGASGCILIPKN